MIAKSEAGWGSGFQSFNILYQKRYVLASPVFEVLAQNENVPFVQSENVPFWVLIQGASMDKGLLTMSSKERERSVVVRLVAERCLRQADGASRLGIGVRQMKRLVQNWRASGDQGLVSRQRGRVSPLRLEAGVEAPLDDANVERFCDLLEEMRKRTDTRFVTITHNPITMARMDRLFGVTMAERGVSQLVSVDLQEAEVLIAAE